MASAVWPTKNYILDMGGQQRFRRTVPTPHLRRRNEKEPFCRKLALGSVQGETWGTSQQRSGNRFT